MNKILFTKRHFLVSAAIGAMLFMFLIVCWLFLLAPKIKDIAEKRKEIVANQTEIIKINQELDKIKAFPNLLDSQFVNEVPVLPNGMNLSNYFQELKELNNKIAISIAHLDLEHRLIYPEEEKAPIQLRGSLIAFDVLAEEGQDIQEFVKGLEDSQRFTKVQQVIYRYNSNVGQNNEYDYSATIVAVVYYLSHYETGQKLQEDSSIQQELGGELKLEVNK